MQTSPKALRLLLDPRLLVPLLLLFVLIVTGPGVFRNALWGDEFRTWRDGIEKPLALVLTWQHNADHAPLGHLLARAGASLFGVEHAWALRLGNYLCGLLCVPALWWMGRTLVSNGVGLLMAAMFAVDPNCLYQITQARMYGILMLAGICAVTAAGSILLRPSRPAWRIALLGTAIGVGIWSHAQIYAIVIALLLLSIGLLFTAHRRAAVALLIAIVIGGAIGGQGIAKIVSRHDAEKIDNPEPMDAGEQLSEALRKLGGRDWITVVLIVSTVGGAVVLHKQQKSTLAMLLVLVVFVAIVNLGVAARYRPVAHARYLTIIQPGMWLAMSVFLLAVCRSQHARTLGIPSVILFIGLCAYEFSRTLEAIAPHPHAQPFADAARYVATHAQPGDRFVVVPRSPSGMYARYYGLTLDHSIDDALRERTSTRRMREAFRAVELDRGRLWVIGLIQASMQPLPRNDDVVSFAETVAASRGFESALVRIPHKEESKRILLLRIDDAVTTVMPSHPR